jgi:hypothetical protein
MHPTGGSLRVFEQFAWFEVGSGKMALSRPAHQRVTHTVGRCFPKLRRAQHQFGIIGDNCEKMIFGQRIFTNE